MYEQSILWVGSTTETIVKNKNGIGKCIGLFLSTMVEGGPSVRNGWFVQPLYLPPYRSMALAKGIQ